MKSITEAWCDGWRIVPRLVLVLVALMPFLLPLPCLAELLPKNRVQDLAIMALQIFVALPFGAHYAAKWCKEFGRERN